MNVKLHDILFIIMQTFLSHMLDMKLESSRQYRVKKNREQMAITKRILLFLLTNFLVILMISLLLHLFNVQPFLTGYGLNLQSLMIFCVLWGFVGALVSLFLSKIMAKSLLRVQVIDPDNCSPDHLELVRTVERLTQQAGLKAVPEIGIYASHEVNAFATGPTQRRSLVAVSSGLLQRLNPKEIEAILGHEIGHIANGDMVTMTLLQGIMNAFVMFLARVLAYFVSGMGRQKDSRQGSFFSYMMFVYLFEIVFMILGSMVVATFSRFREYRADKFGAGLAGKESMISALESLRSLQNIHDPKAEKSSVQALKISAAPKKNILQLFATHPPLEKRIARLKEGI